MKIGGRGQWRVDRTRLEEYIDRLCREAEVRDPADLTDLDPDAGPEREPSRRMTAALR